MPSINCPNIKHPDWIALETKYGREDALRAYIRNEDSIPTISEAEKLLAKTVNNPKAEENLINKLKSFSSKDTDTQFKDIINKIKDVLHTQETIYKNNTKNSSLLEDIETLKEIIANSDELTSLNNFVNEASVRIGNAQVRMNTITSNLEKIDNDINLKPEDIKDITKNVKYDLDQVNQFLSSYNILDDIQKSINDNFLGETETIKLSASLKQAIANRQLVLSQFTDLAKKVMAKSIAEVLKSSNEKLKAGGHSKLVIDEAKLLEEFEMASKDIGVLQNNLDSAIGSTDPLLAAAAKMVKKALFDAYNSQDLPTEQSLRGLYSKTSGSKSSNVKEYNSKYLHQIDSWEKVPVLDDKGKQEKDENGILKFKYDYIKRDALILEYDTARFYKAKYDFAKKLGERPASLEDQKEWNRSWSQWFKENTVPELDEHNNIVGKRPSSKYKNIKYNKLRQDPYYQKLLDIYFEANEKLPISRQLQHGIFPQYLKKGIDRILEGKLNKEIALEEARQAFKITAQDEQFGGLQRLDGTPKKYIPIHGTSLMDQEHLSYDLLESTLKFSQMANRYEALSSIEPDINLLSEIIANRQVAETNFKGKQVINPVTKKPVAKAPGTERITNRFREFIDSQLYGEESLESTFNLAGAEISLDKVANKIGKFTVMNSMAGNLLSGMGRLTVGNLDNLVEAVGNKYNSYLGGLKALGIAKATYWSNAPGMVADWSRQDLPTNYISLLLRDYDALQGQHRDQYGKNISGNFWKKRGNSEALLAVMNGVEHEIQATTFIRMMQQQKVKQGDKQISLFDA